jgi:hypothetical protein
MANPIAGLIHGTPRASWQSKRMGGGGHSNIVTLPLLPGVTNAFFRARQQ